MTEILFQRGILKAQYWFAFDSVGEMRMFVDRRAAEEFAKRQGFSAVFERGDAKKKPIERAV